MRHEIEAVPEEPTEEKECCHYWIIESPQGSTSKGVCKFCGEEKEFRSYWDDGWRDGTIAISSRTSRLEEIKPDEELEDS